MHSRVSGWLRRSRTLSPPSTLRPGSTIAPPPPLEETRDLPASALPLVESASRSDRVYAQGKFLYQGQRKFYVKGVTYGSFPPNRAGYEFPEPDQVDRDLALMHQAGINTILTYTVPPLSLLDQAGAHDIRVLINIPWMGYECFLEERQKRREIRRTIRDAVAGCQRHPAVLMYAVSKELPPQIVRWQGKDKIERFLHELYQVAKEEDPDTLVTYTNYPTTEYLELPFVDVATFNVYLHRREDFCAYLARLQHLAGELPLVMTELGMCSFRHGPTGQANFIDWQLREVFDHGLAGAIVFGWTDPFYQDNTLVEEWGFGLVDADRQPKPSFQVARRHFSIGTPFGSLKEWPKISVVVALHNAGDTIDACLDSLLRVSYPHSLYEVIVVNDGSTDNSQEIIDRYPFRSIVTENQGVSSARNEGFRAATGDIVAYIDSDAEAEPDWLAYLARTFLEGDYAAVGGPNLIPDEDNWIAKCVYRSPGGPTQVMLDDQRAEHIPGCNMAFWRQALVETGGLDPSYEPLIAILLNQRRASPRCRR